MESLLSHLFVDGLAERSLRRSSSSSTAAALFPLCSSAATYAATRARDGIPLLAVVGGGCWSPPFLAPPPAFVVDETMS
jgi:hypothetical protein